MNNGEGKGFVGAVRGSRWMGVLSVVALLVSSPPAAGSLFGVDYDFSGFLRLEGAVSTNSTPNPNNQFGDPFNGRTVTRVPGNPGLPTDGIPIIGNITDAAIPSWSVPLTLLGDEFARPQQTIDNTFNYHVARLENRLELRFSRNLKFVARVRALYNLFSFDDNFDARDFTDERGMIAGGKPRLYHGEPNHFEYRVEGAGRPNPLEFAGRDYFVDLPAFLFEYSRGPLMLRVGNQQTAWGQAIFFQVMDKVDGIDFRRHSILDRALEEFSDKRVPALGVRLGYQFTRSLELDTFAKKFQPSVLPNPNTPYSVVPAQFTVQDQYREGGYHNKINFGGRLSGDLGPFGWQAMFVSRYNPNGAFRWTESGVDKPLPNNLLGSVLNTYCANVLGTGIGNGCGPVLAGTPFEVAPTPVSVVSADEWFWYAAHVRLDGITALNAAIDEFPSSLDLLARSVDDDFDRARNQLNTFFIASEGLRGHIAREYYRENVFGLGLNYIIEASPGSFFDQMILNIETAYTPKRSFTPLSLSQQPLEKNEIEVALVAETYHRFTPRFPATYLVFQALHKSQSDLVGRHMSGYGGDNSLSPTPDSIAPGVSGGANYVAFAFLQPFPAFIWEASAAVLVDVRGGALIQPGIRWTPTGSIAIDAFYNYIDGDLFTSNPNRTLMGSIDFANEFVLRVRYQF